MTRPDPLEDLEVLFRSRHALIHVDSVEEDRVESLLRHVADRAGVPLFVWTNTKGVRPVDQPSGIYQTAEPRQALAHIEASRLAAIYHLRGLAPYLDDPVVHQALRDAAAAFQGREGAIVLTGTGLPFPETLLPQVSTVRLPGPAADEYRDLLLHILRDADQRGRIDLDMSPAEQERLLLQLQGLTLLEAEKILTRAIVEDGRLGPDDLARVVEAKRELVEREGLLEYYPVEETFANVADLATLKEWLRKRQAIIEQPSRATEFGLEFPRGILLLGVPGCGKSLCAKAVAMEWKLPLLKLDPSTLYNKYIGESEKNFKRAVEIAERMAPVVLWIDELEKAFAGADDPDGGVALRVLGGFLTWLQDRRGDVFVVATANDVSRLPPEFLRKGRFDEIFFVDLPGEATRREILGIHLRKRDQDPERFDLDALAAASEGFSGSELESVVVAALYTVFSESAALDTDAIRFEIAHTRPLSRTMAEKVQWLQEWARDRAVRAN